MVKNLTVILVSLSALTLFACTEPEEQRKELEMKLPAGCTFHELGVYKSTNVYAVKCDGHDATTISYYERVGKQEFDRVVVTIE
jgi:hypothetical protein